MERGHPGEGRDPRWAWLAACTLLITLIFLLVAWELFLAPVRPGGSWLVLKVLPLLAPLFGVLHGRRYTFQWSTLLIWLYAAEGSLRTYTDSGWSARLAFIEALLAVGYFAAAVAYLRASRRASPGHPGSATPQ
jgi:uncharacterized membrane protein